MGLTNWIVIKEGNRGSEYRFEHLTMKADWRFHAYVKEQYRPKHGQEEQGHHDRHVDVHRYPWIQMRIVKDDLHCWTIFFYCSLLLSIGPENESNEELRIMPFWKSHMLREERTSTRATNQSPKMQLGWGCYWRAVGREEAIQHLPSGIANMSLLTLFHGVALLLRMLVQVSCLRAVHEWISYRMLWAYFFHII